MNDEEFYEDEVFDRVFRKLEELYVTGHKTDINGIGEYWYTGSNTKRKEYVKQILEEIYQKGKDDKFKDIGYLDVDEFYPDEKEAKQ